MKTFYPTADSPAVPRLRNMCSFGHVRPATKEAIINHARRAYPSESCGFVICDKGKETYRPVSNIHPNSKDFFELDPAELLPVLGDRANLRFFVHSHPDWPATPSANDRVLCDHLLVPFIILSFPALTWETLVPSGWEQPFIGRVFEYGKTDCLTLVRDYYKRVLLLDIKDYDRDVVGWWDQGKSLYLDRAEDAGFVHVSDLQAHDMLLFAVESAVPNHAAVYVGDNMLLHHVFGRLSCYQPLGGFWLKTHTHTIRHKSLCHSSK